MSRWLAPRIALVIGLALVATCRMTAAQKAEAKYDVDYFGTDQGLLHENVSAVRQTRDGYLWIGGDGGLSRYDGVTFTPYRIRVTPGLIGDTVRSLFEDSAGVLWIGTSRGLCSYDGRSFKTELELPSGSTVLGMCEDREKNLWVATMGGLVRRRGGKFETFEKEPLIGQYGIACVFADSIGRVWIGLYNRNEMIVYEHGAFHSVGTHGVISGSINSMTEGPAGTFWFATRGDGIVRMRDGNFTKPAEGQLLTRIISRLFVDTDESLWIGTIGLQRLDAPAGNEVETVLRLGSPSIRDMMRDREGSIWFAAYGDGLVRVRPARYKILNAASGLPGNFVRTVAQEPDGGLVLAQGGAGAVRIAPGGAISRLVPEGRTQERDEAMAAYPTRSGDLWVALQRSLVVWHGGRMTEYPEYPSCRALFEDSKGTVWIGGYERGLHRWHGGKIEDVVLPPAVARASPCGFAEDTDGTVYVATMQFGILQFKGSDVQILSSHNGTGDETVRAIYIDSDRNLWVGSKAGISVRHEGRWYYQPWVCDVLDQYITMITQVPGDNLILGTSRGVVRVSRSGLLDALQHEARPSGLRQELITDGARTGNIGTACFPGWWTTKTGEVWIAARRGAIVIDPKKIGAEEEVPPVKIEHLVADGMSYGSVDRAHLRPGVRQLRIDYTAPTFVQADRVRFAYRLDGYDNTWVDAGTRRVVFYNDLPPRDYVFRVKACNSDGVWNDAGISLGFTIPPFFYQTIWFRLAIFAAVGGLAVGAYRWRVRQLRRRAAELQGVNVELERRIAERTSELAKSFEALRTSENFYHSLVESLPQIIVRKDTEGRFTYANSGFAELLRRPLGEIIGRKEAEFYPPDEAARFREADEKVMTTRKGIEFESVIETPAGKRFNHVKKVPILNEQQQPIGVQVLFWDITAFRETEAKLRAAESELIETSRLAGMAEVATGVLHNIGNALNSVNVSASLALDAVRSSRGASLAKIAQLLEEQRDRLAEFFATDPRASKIPNYLAHVGESLAQERAMTLRELEALLRGLDHLKEIVAAQQTYARASGITEAVTPSDLLEQALKISEAHMSSRDIELVRAFQPTPRVMVQRQQVLQILVNLIRNAKESMKDAGQTQQKLVLTTAVSAEGRVLITVTDNGQGIAPENITRIFAFGFTTKKTGHGFGLHSSALVAKELGGSLVARSEGVGHGATLVLELPPAEPIPFRAAEAAK